MSEHTFKYIDVPGGKIVEIVSLFEPNCVVRRFLPYKKQTPESNNLIEEKQEEVEDYLVDTSTDTKERGSIFED